MWVADKQEVDTARLEVQGVLTVRLPEAYLAGICFEGESGIQYTGQPAVISIDRQGYTENAEFSSNLQVSNNAGDANVINLKYTLFESAKEIVSREVQPSNADLSIELSDAGKLISVNAVQSQSALHL